MHNNEILKAIILLLGLLQAVGILKIISEISAQCLKTGKEA